jgi:ABC-type glycerol-3-phosphate transport system substrate-binding protein
MRYCQSRHREFSSGLTALAIVIAASAIGGLSPAAAADDVQTYTDLAALEAAAKEEGTLNIYTAPEYDFLITGFKEAYPWATVNFTGLEPPETAAKVTAELGAGVNNVDIANLKLRTRTDTRIRRHRPTRLLSTTRISSRSRPPALPN